MNQRPLGYEPNELPSCSTPRYKPSLSACCSAKSKKFRKKPFCQELGITGGRCFLCHSNHYGESWCCVTDSNRHDSGYEPDVLPLHKHNLKTRHQTERITHDAGKKEVCHGRMSREMRTNNLTGHTIREVERTSCDNYTLQNGEKSNFWH